MGCCEQEGGDIAPWLMGKGLDLLAEDENQRTALDVAAAFGNKGILEMFARK